MKQRTRNVTRADAVAAIRVLIENAEERDIEIVIGVLVGDRLECFFNVDDSGEEQPRAHLADLLGSADGSCHGERK